MKRVNWFIILMVCFVAAGVQAGDIVPGLDDSTARADFTVAHAGIDIGAGGDLTEDITDQITLAARFNPDTSQSTGGPYIVIEVGGTTYGTGLYLGDGQLIFASKAGLAAAVPTSMNDTDFSDQIIVITVGAVNFGAENKVYVSMDINTGEVICNINNVITTYTITNSSNGNPDGNHSVSFLGDGAIVFGHMGGLTEGGETTFPLLFWNNAQNMTQTAGYNNQRGQVFEAVAANLDILPHNPNPTDGAINVDPEVVTQLSFYTAEDPENPGSQNPDVTGHWITVYDVTGGEPNFTEPPLEESGLIPDGTDPITYAFTFDEDDVVYWQVEEQISGASKGDPGNILGLVWHFNAIPSTPSITVSPIDDAAFPTGQADFSCEFISKSTITDVKWYKEAGETDIEVDDSDEDITIDWVNTGGNSYTSTLEIDDVEKDDEGYYYCRPENVSGGSSSDPASLGVKRQVAHWTLDEVNLVGGQYVDSSGEGHNADPNIVPGSASFVDGVDPTETGDALDLTVEPLAAADSGDWAPSMYTGEVTISAWLNWDGPNGSWQGVVSNRLGPPPANLNFYIEIRLDNGNLQIGGIPGVGDLAIDPLPIDEWAHLAITARAGEALIYLNGEVVASNTTGQAVAQNVAPLYIGALNRTDGATGAETTPLINMFNGAMDDVQLYNYAITAEEVIDIYYAVLEEFICLYPDALDVANAETGLNVDDEEFSGDCLVTIEDFAVFASHWLNCGFYPETECP